MSYFTRVAIFLLLFISFWTCCCWLVMVCGAVCNVHVQQETAWSSCSTTIMAFYILNRIWQHCALQWALPFSSSLYLSLHEIGHAFFLSLLRRFHSFALCHCRCRRHRQFIFIILNEFFFANWIDHNNVNREWEREREQWIQFIFDLILPRARILLLVFTLVIRFSYVVCPEAIFKWNLIKRLIVTSGSSPFAS